MSSPAASPLLLGEDDRHLYLLKPAGLPVFPPHAEPAGDCLLARAAALLGPGPWPPGFEGGLAHRLDTATSGVVVAARTPAALAALRAEFSGGLLRKFYVFRSAGGGAVDFRERLVTVPLAHHPRRADRMIWPRTADPERTPHRGKWYPAWTTLSRRGDLWQAEIRTGIMHQVRAHAAFAGLALDGDALYGGAPGAYTLHHRLIVSPGGPQGAGWRSPEAPLPH